MIELTKGANAPVSQDRINVVLRWSGDLDLDLAALLCTSAGKVRSDEDFVFYNQPVHWSNAVSHRGKLAGPVSTETVELNLAMIEPHIDKVVFSSSMDRGSFGQLSSISIELQDFDTGVPIIGFVVLGASVETAMIAGELYRRNGTWKFRAVGQGYASGLRGVATDFGISVDTDAPESHKPAPPPQEREIPSAPYPGASTNLCQVGMHPPESQSEPGQPRQSPSPVPTHHPSTFDNASVTTTTRHQLPDQGDHLVRLARDVAGERGAAVVAAEVDRIRRSNGALVQADLKGYSKAKDGPLHLLSTLLSLEAISVCVWAESGFGMMQRRSARKEAEDLSRSQGVDAAVNWALSNAPKSIHVDVLRGMLNNLLDTGTLDADFFRHELARTFRKWK